MVAQLLNGKTKVLLCACMVTLAACKKEAELITGNQAPYYDGVPTVLVENYVNRLFIDLLGREPLDVEMQAEVALLESSELSIAARQALVNKLMTSAAFLADDSSYTNKYYTRQYELYKARCLEGISDDGIDGYIGLAEQDALADSLNGNTLALIESNAVLQRLRDLKGSRTQYRDAAISIAEVMRRMVINSIYDEINMNSFNFINATFDNLLLRYPTQAEFDAAYAMVENSQPSVLFGSSGQNKSDYVHILVNTTEFQEGMVRWCYRTFLGRDAETHEVVSSMQHFHTSGDLQRVQVDLFTSNEYANL
jgi:hypothetical protein